MNGRLLLLTDQPFKCILNTFIQKALAYKFASKRISHVDLANSLNYRLSNAR